jgi:hypothetical protein
VISLRDAPTEVQLRTYLNDHLAAATGGVELAKRCLGANRGTPLGDYLEQFLSEITEERDVLVDLISRFGFRHATPKITLANLGEKVGRLKLNGQVLGYSDLARLIELEGLTVGVRAKLGMYQALDAVQDAYPELAEMDIERLEELARGQHDRLEHFRREAARVAFTS